MLLIQILKKNYEIYYLLQLSYIYNMKKMVLR